MVSSFCIPLNESKIVGPVNEHQNCFHFEAIKKQAAVKIQHKWCGQTFSFPMDKCQGAGRQDLLAGMFNFLGMLN